MMEPLHWPSAGTMGYGITRGVSQETPLLWKGLLKKIIKSNIKNKRTVASLRMGNVSFKLFKACNLKFTNGLFYRIENRFSSLVFAWIMSSNAIFNDNSFHITSVFPWVRVSVNISLHPEGCRPRRAAGPSFAPLPHERGDGSKGPKALPKNAAIKYNKLLNNPNRLNIFYV